MTSSSLSKALPLRKKSPRTRHQHQQHSTPDTSTRHQYPTPVTDCPLSIELLPEKLQWWDEERYWLVHKATGLRVPGSWSLPEALEIQESSKHWDWTVDPKSRIPNCQQQILDLCVRVCDRKTTQVNQKRLPSQQESAVFCNLAEKK